MAEAHAQWTNIAASGAFESPRQFMNFVGLDQPPVEPGINDNVGKNRGQLVYCINMVLGAVSRCAWPDDPERAQRGGFVIGSTESGNPICRNPATTHVVPLLQHILSQMRVFNQLWSPDAQSALSPGYQHALDMLDVEKTNLLGLVGYISHSPEAIDHPTKPQSPLERMQHFLTAIHDACYHVLGAASISLGRDLYQLPGLGPAIVGSLLANLEVSSDNVNFFLESFWFFINFRKFQIID